MTPSPVPPVHVRLPSQTRLAGLAIPLIRGLLRQGRRVSLSVPEPLCAAVHLATGIGPSARPSGARLLDLWPHAGGRPEGPHGKDEADHAPLTEPDGPRSLPYWKQCQAAMAEAGLGIVEPVPYPPGDKAEPPVSGSRLLQLSRIGGAGARYHQRLVVHLLARPQGTRYAETGGVGSSVELARSGSAVRPPRLAEPHLEVGRRREWGAPPDLRGWGLVITDSLAGLAWSGVWGCRCVAFLRLDDQPSYHLPAQGPATLLVRLGAPATWPDPLEVAAAAWDLAIGPAGASPRIVLLTDEPRPWEEAA